MLLMIGGLLLMFLSLGLASWLAVRQSIDRAPEERLTLAETTADYLSYILRGNLARLEDVALDDGVDMQDNNPEPEQRALHNAYIGSLFNEGFCSLTAQGGCLTPSLLTPSFKIPTSYCIRL